MSDFVESIDYETGTSIQTFNIIETKKISEGYEILLELDLDSGYVLEGVKMNITNEDFTAYETNDIQEVVKYALGFFDQAKH
ncbi:hypothetical protein BABA_08466 [Neobacillus bataviensis LMG 21833]|uniref:Uncharacterized protein n=1 Tax=Neobacillus bataviensis LMG 21833 TaxID=1117379 RepID=K6E8Z0_9BACI|nr:hypothetical protein [Neobacillus bataviensis]EKN69811.1 hypothetical protein BABA_08466 [Neobacillus bataviensis LMG 21833]